MNQNKLDLTKKWVVLHLTTNCNFKCRFCIIDYKRGWNPPKKKEILHRMAYFNKCEKFILSGGEPTTVNFFFDVIKLVRKKAKNIALQTNGLELCDKKFCQKLVKLGVNDITISFHSHNKDKFDYLTQTHGFFDKVLQGLKNILDFGITVKTSTVISSFNKNDIINIVKFLSKFDKLYKIKLVYASFNQHSNRDDYISLSECGKILKKIEKLNIKNLSIENVPLCIYDSRKINANNLNVFKIVLLTKDGIVDPQHRVFIEKCNKCKLRSQCQGLYKNYHLLFNPEIELKPFI